MVFRFFFFPLQLLLLGPTQFDPQAPQNRKGSEDPCFGIG